MWKGKEEEKPCRLSFVPERQEGQVKTMLQNEAIVSTTGCCEIHKSLLETTLPESQYRQ